MNTAWAVHIYTILYVHGTCILDTFNCIFGHLCVYIHVKHVQVHMPSCPVMKAVRHPGEEANTCGTTFRMVTENSSTWMSERAFVMEAVPLKATTMMLLFQPRRHLVSRCSSQNRSLSVSEYRLSAVCRLSVVLGACCCGVALSNAFGGVCCLDSLR